MLRFVDSTLTSEPRRLRLNSDPTDQILSLEEALTTLLPRIDQLDRLVHIAQNQCHYPSEYDLTHDESAAIYLYTMKAGDFSFHDLIGKDLTSSDPSLAESWCSYLTLLHTALQKLPNARIRVWRGFNRHAPSELHRGDELIWWNISSCSASVDQIKDSLAVDSTLLLIDAVNGKNISKYSNYPEENEVILCPGTRLRVVSNLNDQKPFRELHLQETTDTNVEKSLFPKAADSSRSNRSIPSNNRTVLLSVLSFVALLLGLLLVNVNKKSLSISVGSSTPNTRVNTMENTYQLQIQISRIFENDFEGEWKDGKKHGKGKIEYVNGNTYVGDWADDMATGEGIFSWANGDRYEGRFENGRRHGKGSYLFANGDQYVGDWVEDKKEGHGVSTWAAGSVWAGDKYDGEYSDDKKRGKGSLYFASDDSYTGEWIDDKQEGEGVFNWADGDRYEGGFKAGKLHGKGSYYFKNGNKFVGDWIDGERETDHGAFTSHRKPQDPMIDS